MNKKNIIVVTTLTLFLWIAIMFVRAYSFQWAAIAHSIAFVALTWWALVKYAPKIGMWRLLLILSSPRLFELMVRILISDNLFSLPVTITPLWAVISVALFYYYRKYWILVICALFWLFGTTEGYHQWVEWGQFGNMPTQTINLAGCEVSDTTHTFKLSDVDSEYLILDVWYSACGVCLRELPEVEALRNEYKDKDNIDVVSVFVTLLNGETIYDGLRIMTERDCDIPVWCIGADNPILHKCKIDLYPRVLILDKERRVIHNGSLDFAKRKLKIIMKE